MAAEQLLQVGAAFFDIAFGKFQNLLRGVETQRVEPFAEICHAVGGFEFSRVGNEVSASVDRMGEPVLDLAVLDQLYQGLGVSNTYLFALSQVSNLAFFIAVVLASV